MTGSGPTSRVERPRLPSEDREARSETQEIERVAVESVLEAADVSERPTLEEELIVDRLPPFPVPWRHPLKCFAWIVRTLFGLASLTLLLAVSAAVPLVNFWVLGYFLDVTGRIGRTGKLRAAFPLLGLAPRFGSIVLGTWLCVLPLRLLSGAASDAALIDPNGRSAAGWQIVLTLTSWLMTAHLCDVLAIGN